MQDLTWKFKDNTSQKFADIIYWKRAFVKLAEHFRSPNISINLSPLAQNSKGFIHDLCRKRDFMPGCPILWQYLWNTSTEEPYIDKLSKVTCVSLYHEHIDYLDEIETLLWSKIHFKGGEGALTMFISNWRSFWWPTPSIFVQYEAEISNLSSPNDQIWFFVTDSFQKCEIWTPERIEGFKKAWKWTGNIFQSVYQKMSS